MTNTNRVRINEEAGRTKFEQEQINLQKTLELLEMLSSRNCLEGKFVFYHPTKSEKFYDHSRTPGRSILAVRAIFNGAHSFKGNHQVYYSDRSEMHYIELSATLKNKYRGAHMEFLIENP